MKAAPKQKYTKEEIRLAAEADLLQFIRLVAPQRVLGDIHKEIIKYWTRPEAKSHQLTLIPRDHQKSVLTAYRVAWAITKDPTLTVLYISSTANLAEKQLGLIKQIITSPVYTNYWSNMVEPDEGKRELWTKSEIALDHPLRKKEFVRDPTVLAAGLTKGITGLHFRVNVLDDIVVMENAYTADGRRKVEAQYSLLASIGEAYSQEWVVGTRYHPSDLYGKMMELTMETVNEDGDISGKELVYEVFQRQVEDIGDGTGNFLWERQQRADGKWFGFNAQVLALKRAKYLDTTQYRAQYYNDPNDPDNEAIGSDFFQYYEPEFLKKRGGTWFFKDKPLRTFAAMDFAFSLSKRSDFSALATIGVDDDWNIYILDVTRFKTDRVRDYYDKLFNAHERWNFRSVRAEVSVAQQVIVNEIRDLCRREGLSLIIDDYRPDRYAGNKQERIDATLRPRYENRSMWHYHSGITTELEEELIRMRPKNDDIKDALANAVAIAKAPPKQRAHRDNRTVVEASSRFGGIG